MSRPQKIHPPLGASFGDVLKAVADGPGIPSKPKEFLVHGLDENAAKELESSAPDGVTVKVRTILTRSEASPTLTMVVISIPSTVALNIFSSWLHDKIKKHGAAQIKHGGKTVEKSKAGIRRAAEDQVDIGRND